MDRERMIRIGSLVALCVCQGVLAQDRAVSPENAFVCQPRAKYQLDVKGELKTQAVGDLGTFTVDTRSGTVQGDVVSTQEGWKVINAGNSANAVKLVAIRVGELTALSIETNLSG